MPATKFRSVEKPGARRAGKSTLSDSDQPAKGSVARVFNLLPVIGAERPGGLRLTERAALPRPTAHRIPRARRRRRRRLRRTQHALHAGPGAVSPGGEGRDVVGLRELARPTLLRLTASLGETLFLLVHNGYDAVCMERSAGPLPIRSFTGDIGGRVPLGIGQGSVAILAFLPAAEQNDVIRHNLPRMRA
jgi:DNA-binding IclR family transcriptional regulator